jgi:hypothetical protein
MPALLAGVLAAGLVALAAAPAPLAWTAIPADEVAVLYSRRHHSTRFGIRLPPPRPHEGFARQMNVTFPRSLDSAKVNAYGSGPRHRVMLLDEQRVRGNAFAMSLPPLTLDWIEVEVHHHLRTPPLPPEVLVGREVRR